jgi:phytoene dehydrogenase-like protein
VLGLLTGPGADLAGAASDASKDWPCKQALVPELSYQLLWTGPSPEPYFDNWRGKQARTNVIAEVTSLALPRAKARERLADYLAARAPVGDDATARIFAGIFQTIQDKRREAIAAIKRYSRGQQRAMDRIAELLRRLDAQLSADAPDRPAVRRTRAELDMTRRVFEERRRSIRALCEQPTLMEQRLGDLARVLQQSG